jgi:hypothetical protein
LGEGARIGDRVGHRFSEVSVCLKFGFRFAFRDARPRVALPPLPASRSPVRGARCAVRGARLEHQAHQADRLAGLQLEADRLAGLQLEADRLAGLQLEADRLAGLQLEALARIRETKNPASGRVCRDQGPGLSGRPDQPPRVLKRPGFSNEVPDLDNASGIIIPEDDPEPEKATVDRRSHPVGRIPDRG